MYTGTLLRLREFIRRRRYVMTLHAEDEMAEDGLTVYDIESCILTGVIVERQRDRRTGEWKCVVRGQPLAGEEYVVTVTKISPTGKLVILTVYRA